MASQVIRYKGRGFNAKVDPIQLWIAALSQEMVGDEISPKWVRELGGCWREEALYGFSVVAVRLDEELEERDDLQPLVVVAQRVLHRLESSESAEVQEVSLPSFGLQSDIPHENAPLNIHYVIEVGRAFIGLLSGDFPSDDNPYPFVSMYGLTRYPQVPKGPQVAPGDREAQMAAHLPLRDVEEAREVISKKFGITFERESESEAGDVYCGRRGDDTISLYVNSKDENRQRYRRLPARAIVLEIETKVAHCREYETMIRGCFPSLPGRIRKIYLLRAFAARPGKKRACLPKSRSGRKRGMDEQSAGG